MTTSALVGPLPQIRYHDGTREVYTPPVNTCDPRYVLCTDHHPACDCREAVHAEDWQEFRGYRRELEGYEEWAVTVAKLHQKDPNPYVGDRCDECNKPWPCSTWRLTVAVSRTAKYADQYTSGVME